MVFFSKISGSCRLGFGAGRLHSRQALLDGVQPAPEFLGFGLQIGLDPVRLGRFGKPTRPVSGPTPSSAEKAETSSKSALQAAAAAPEPSAIKADIGLGFLFGSSAKSESAAGPRPLARWPCSIISWHDDTSCCGFVVPGVSAVSSFCGPATVYTPETVSLSSDAPDSSAELDRSRCAGAIPPSLPRRQRLRPRPQGGASPANS
jgi:hypothetical protein